MRDTLWAWTEAVESYVLDVLREERRGMLAAITRFVLHLLSKLYLVGLKLRRWLYRRSGRLP